MPEWERIATEMRVVGSSSNGRFDVEQSGSGMDRRTDRILESARWSWTRQRGRRHEADEAGGFRSARGGVIVLFFGLR